MGVASGKTVEVAESVVGDASVGVVVAAGVCCDSDTAGLLLRLKAITMITTTQATTSKIHHKLFLLIASPPFTTQEPS